MTAAGWGRAASAGATYRIAYQAAQTPAHLDLVCALAGVAWRRPARLQVADLGCGRGYTANVLAAANPAWQVIGLDHSAGAIAEARSVAARAGLGNVRFVEADLGALEPALLEGLPPLDLVTLHGVWTWVDDAVRDGIVRLLARRLKPGGLVYLGYNAMPAAAADHTLQRLLMALAGPSDPGPGGTEAAARRAMAALRGIAPGLPLPRTPMLQRLLDDPPRLEPAFVAHEFLTDHWRPVYHEDLCAALAPARLEHVGSSNLFEALPGLFATPEQLAVMQALPAGAPREFVKDLVLPRSFRADVFVRGRVPARGTLDRIVLAPSRPLADERLVLSTGVTEVALDPAHWAVVRERLACGPQPLAALREGLGRGAPSSAELLVLLCANELVQPWWPAPPHAVAARFNILQGEACADGGAAPGHFALAAPGAGGALPADALDLALVAALLQGASPDHPAALAARLRGPMATPDRVAPRIAERLPVWRRFGVL